MGIIPCGQWVPFTVSPMTQNPTHLTPSDLAGLSNQRRLTDWEALEELVIDNPDLERLETLVDQFNIFEAVGMVHQEIRHSFFLRFLLDPNESHGLGDIFLKRLLQRVLTGARGTSSPISLIDLDVWELEGTTVLREWSGIDILILNTTHKLAVIIENKVYSDEHSEQLKRYWSVIEQNYPAWRILGIFLTRDGSLPSDERYLPVSYVVVADMIERLINSRASMLGEDVRTLLEHYTQMLRRHLVSGSEIDELCLRLYKRHQRALDLIFERRPDKQKMLQDEVEKVINHTPGFEVDKSTKSSVVFAPTSWDVPALLTGTNWNTRGRIMVFWFEIKPTGVRLILEIGPGDGETRNRLFRMASSNKPLFSPGKTLYPQWCRIYNKDVLSKKVVEEADITDIHNNLQKAWGSFRDNDLPKIEQVLRNEGFI
jgi:hypothetical protein